jgi:hypothetical protein
LPSAVRSVTVPTRIRRLALATTSNMITSAAARASCIVVAFHTEQMHCEEVYA